MQNHTGMCEFLSLKYTVLEATDQGESSNNTGAHSCDVDCKNFHECSS